MSGRWKCDDNRWVADENTYERQMKIQLRKCVEMIKDSYVESASNHRSFVSTCCSRVCRQLRLITDHWSFVSTCCSRVRRQRRCYRPKRFWDIATRLLSTLRRAASDRDNGPNWNRRRRKRKRREGEEEERRRRKRRKRRRSRQTGEEL